MTTRNPKPLDRRIVYAQKINANNDLNGNPRWGWYVYSKTGALLGFVDEGYRGRRALTVAFPKAVELPVIACTPTEYRGALTHEVATRWPVSP